MSANAILKLQKVRFAADQAEALTAQIDTHATSKTDDPIGTKAEPKADIATIRTDLTRISHARKPG